MSHQYRFSCIQHGTYRQEIDVKLDDIETLPQILEAFEQFLRGCGFKFDGHIDVYNAITPDEQPLVPIVDDSRRCSVCGLTHRQLSSHTCYDVKCGFKS